MEKIHIDRLKTAAEFYRGKTILAMVPLRISVKEGINPIECRICLKNVGNRTLFGLTEDEYRDIFLSQQEGVSDRIESFLKDKVNA